MRKILNIVLGDMSTGELGIALQFVKTQTSQKFDNYFIIPEEKRMIIDDPLIKVFSLSHSETPIRNREIFNQYVSSVSPDLIILFDAFTFEYSQSWTGCNMELLKGYGIPIAALDEYEYTMSEFKLDYYGIFVKKLPDLLKECDYILKNCPLSMPKEKEDKKVFYYRVFDEYPILNFEMDKSQLRKEFFGDLSDDEVVVFFTTSDWEVEGAYSFACQNQLAKWLGPIVFNYLSDLHKKITLFHVGKENWEIKTNNYVRYIHRDSLPSSQFEKAIMVSDMFITYNAVSISLSKAVLYHIPCVVLNNSKIITFENVKSKLLQRPIWYQNMARDVKKVYPFSASLFGWNHFLKPCFEGNKYIESIDITNVFNYTCTKEILERNLFDTYYRDTVIKRQEDFWKSYFMIPSSEQVMEQVFCMQNQ